MRVLVFDCETTGLVDFKLPADHPQQPHICEIAAIWTRGPGEHETALDTLITPNGWTIPEDTRKVHGITTAMCEEDGAPLGDALIALMRLFDQADRIVGFGVAFDLKIVRGGCRRLGMDDRYASVNPKKFDLMHKAKPLCAIPPTDAMKKHNFKSFKPPTLKEATSILLKRDLGDAHQALADVEATADLYWLIEGGAAAPAPAAALTSEPSNEEPKSNAPEPKLAQESVDTLKERGSPPLSEAMQAPDDECDPI